LAGFEHFLSLLMRILLPGALKFIKKSIIRSTVYEGYLQEYVLRLSLEHNNKRQQGRDKAIEQNERL